jgi:DNA-binding response OmpR family regulator
MEPMYKVLWVGRELRSPVIEAGLSRAGCRQVRVDDVADGLQVLRNGDADLVVLESPRSCVQGELLAVRLKNAAAHVPILLLCDPLDKATPQVFFVNLILGMNASPELLLKAIQTLLPGHPEKKTGT